MVPLLKTHIMIKGFFPVSSLLCKFWFISCWKMFLLLLGFICLFVGISGSIYMKRDTECCNWHQNKPDQLMAQQNRGNWPKFKFLDEIVITLIPCCLWMHWSNYMAQKLNVLYLLVKKPDIPFVVFQKLRMGCYAVKCRIGKERHKNNNTNQLQGKTSLNEIR